MIKQDPPHGLCQVMVDIKQLFILLSINKLTKEFRSFWELFPAQPCIVTLFLNYFLVLQFIVTCGPITIYIIPDMLKSVDIGHVGRLVGL